MRKTVLKGLLFKLLCYRGSYMSAHVLFNLFNKLGEKYKIRDFIPAKCF